MTFPQAESIIIPMTAKRSGDRLNIFIDETGEFGFNRRAARFYGVSLVFHEQKDTIENELSALDKAFAENNFHGMIHMGDLINGHGDYRGMSVPERKKLFQILYRFSRKIKIRSHSILLEKAFSDSVATLEKTLGDCLRELIEDNLAYFQKFGQVVVYYDGGQRSLSKVIDAEFGRLAGYERRPDFDHTEKKLFQIADMLTFLDKLTYKYKARMKLSRSELLFFSMREISRISRELERRRITKKAPLRMLF